MHLNLGHMAYGMIEQTGSIFLECENCGAFRSSCFSEVYVRDKNFNILKEGKGLIQIYSILPSSYRGGLWRLHSST